MRLSQVTVRPVIVSEESRFRELMQAHHYLGALPKIGHTLWYIATWIGEWVALLSFSAAALKCRARDDWISWDFRHQYDRLHLIANNSRFLLLPHFHQRNFASKVLSLCQRRIQCDWDEHFGYPLLLLETFVDPTPFSARSIGRPNSDMWAIPEGINASATVTATFAVYQRGSLSSRCSAMRAPCLFARS